ncbi:MAG: undecaprenyl/decaprenyl-phosphate alpha-N-acetylglucosaminyl 1-phosphate transferase [Bacteroidales bacterium]|nr:undecaprenyl/decaprenyl-phosphate alpha-N-acetylglucosaminyl 1-phosphate transferase [Bacteroidales bacterium]
MGNAHIYLLVFCVSVVLGLLLNRFFLTRNMSFLIKKANKDAIRWSSQSKPIFGGISFFSLFIIAMIAYLFIYGYEAALSKEYLALLVSITISFIMGLADDLISTPPYFKFLVQLLVAAIFIYSDIYIIISPIAWLNYLITVIWVVGIMNSINMLDNMDAITSSVSLSIIFSVVIFVLLGTTHISTELSVLIAVVFCGALISFLFYNWHPSKMYMGDNGSQILGSFLAFLGIIYFWNGINIVEASYALNTKQIAIVASAFIIPLTDTTSVSINRILKGKSPFVGGRDHTTHHLSYLGLPERYIAILLLSLNSVGIFLAYKIIMHNNWSNKYFWLYLIYPVAVFIILYSITKIFKPKKQNDKK